MKEAATSTSSGCNKHSSQHGASPTKEQLLGVARKSVELYADHSSDDMDDDLFYLLKIDAPHLIDVFRARRAQVNVTPAAGVLPLLPKQQLDQNDPELLTGITYGLFTDTNGTPRYLNMALPETQLEVVTLGQEACPISQTSAPDVETQHLLNIIRKSVWLYADHHSGDMDNDLLHQLLDIKAFHLFHDYEARHSSIKAFRSSKGKEPFQNNFQPSRPSTINDYPQSHHKTQWLNQDSSNGLLGLPTNDYITQYNGLQTSWGEAPTDSDLLCSPQDATGPCLELDSFWGPTNQPLDSPSFTWST